MLKTKLAVVAGFVTALALTPAAFAQVAAGYAIQLGQTAGAASQMPHLDPRVGYGPQDWRDNGDSAQAQNHQKRHQQVQDDDDDSTPENPGDRDADWIQVK